MARIVIDLGHGGSDPGACANGYEEASSVLVLQPTLKSLLESLGHTVIFTRCTDRYVSLNERVMIERRFGADLFVSIHRNSYNNASAEGVETWYDYNSNRGKVLAACINAQVSQSFRTNRGIKMCKANCRFAVLKGTYCAAALIELGFITNHTDNKSFYNHEVVIAHQITAGIQDYIGLDTDGLNTSETVEPPKTIKENLDMNVLSFCKSNPCNLKNAISPAVPIMQALLKKLGYYKMKVDNHFGNGCYEAVKAFQKAYGISVDGSCGPATFEKLFAAV